MNFKGQSDCILEILYVVLFVLLFSFFVMNKYELIMYSKCVWLSLSMKLCKFYTKYLMLKGKRFNFSTTSIIP